MSEPIKLLLKIGNASTNIKDGVYEYDVSELTSINNMPSSILINDSDFDDFVDYLCHDGFSEFWEYMYIDYSFSENRRKLINNVNWDAFYCAALTKDDAKYFRSIYEHYKSEIDALPDENIVSIHPTLRVKHNSLKLLCWLTLFIEHATNTCLRPAIVSCLFSDFED